MFDLLGHAGRRDARPWRGNARCHQRSRGGLGSAANHDGVGTGAASTGVGFSGVMSPLATTGTFTAALTAGNGVVFGCPFVALFAVRPCTVSMATPAASAARAMLTAFLFSWLQPVRILKVTGTLRGARRRPPPLDDFQRQGARLASGPSPAHLLQTFLAGSPC